MRGAWQLPDEYPLRIRIERAITTAVYAMLVSGSLAAGALLALERHADPAPDRPAEHICKYVADFTYTHRRDGFVTEDAKGFITPEFELKAKLFKAIFGREIRVS